MARINFIELPARNLGPARVFYSTVFGRKLTDFGPSYSCTMTGNVYLGLQGDMSEAPTMPCQSCWWRTSNRHKPMLRVPGGHQQADLRIPGRSTLSLPRPQRLELAIMQAN